MLFTELKNSYPFRSYRYSKIAILGQSLINFYEKVKFEEIPRKKIERLQLSSGFAQIWTRNSLDNFKEPLGEIFQKF